MKSNISGVQSSLRLGRGATLESTSTDLLNIKKASNSTAFSDIRTEGIHNNDYNSTATNIVGSTINAVDINANNGLNLCIKKNELAKFSNYKSTSTSISFDLNTLDIYEGNFISMVIGSDIEIDPEEDEPYDYYNFPILINNNLEGFIRKLNILFEMSGLAYMASTNNSSLTITREDYAPYIFEFIIYKNEYGLINSHIENNIANYMTLPLPVKDIKLTGNATYTTAAKGTNNTNLATNAFVQTAVSDRALDSTVVHNSGNETVGGNKSFSGNTTLSGTNTITGNITSSGINTFSGTNTFSGNTNLSSATNISGNITSGGTNSFSGANTFSGTINVPTVAVSDTSTKAVNTTYIGNKFKVVNALPANPDANTFYFIYE